MSAADAALETVLKRDRAIVGAALIVIAALAWAYVIVLAGGMTPPAPAMPDMPGMNMGAMTAAPHPWSAPEFALTFAMWTVMMAGMMLPSAAPMILLYARVGRQAREQAQPFAATGWFAAGYLLAWAAFALAASAAQAALVSGAWLTPMLVAASRRASGAVLIAAGIYQWTPLKNACLTQCQAPLSFLQRHGGFKRQLGGALGLGFRHGLYCVGCCWALMALLFVGGVMNVLWIAVLAGVVLLEKLLPMGRAVSRLAGLVFVGAGAIFLATP